MLEGFEYFFLQGWQPDWFRNIQKSQDSVDYLELLSNMAGNSYTTFHMLPFKAAVWATYSRFSVGPATIDQEGGCVASSSCPETPSAERSDSD